MPPRAALNAPDEAPMAAHRHLAAAHRELLAAWVRRFHPRPQLSAQALTAMQQLLLPRSRDGRTALDAGAWREHIQYTATRLAKLGAPIGHVHEAWAKFRPLALDHLRSWIGHGGAEGAADGALDWLQQQTQMIVAESYVTAQESAVQALLAVLDAELHAGDLHELLERLLARAAEVFPVRWGEVLLAGGGNGHTGRQLHHAAAYGLPAGMIEESLGVGEFFRGVLHRGMPAFMMDAANDPRVSQPYFRAFEVKSVWAVPLVRHHPRRQVLGVLALGFERAYVCLPKERELLLALAERSTLAIERTRMAERLQQEQRRSSELSRRLLAAQDEERRRISRDLHDETGQSLLALRLYLEMALRQPSAPAARPWLTRGVTLVDQSVDELRRILAQLSPLALDELGLEAALRREVRRLARQQQWHTRCRFVMPAGAPRLERGLEVLAYRVVVEGLRNIARHARARQVTLRVVVQHGELHIHLQDDGVGLPNTTPMRQDSPTQFGLAGMRERVRLAGGELQVHSQPGQGVALTITIPLAQSAPATATMSAAAPA